MRFFNKKNIDSTLALLVKTLKSKRFAFKTLWSLSFCIPKGVCSYTLAKAIMNYLDYEIVISITVRSGFPSKMTTKILCNSNGLTTDTGINWAIYTYPLYGINQTKNYLNLTIIN